MSKKLPTQTLIKLLKEKGLSKYKISQIIEVAYTTVTMWEKGIWQANEKNHKKLMELLSR